MRLRSAKTSSQVDRASGDSSSGPHDKAMSKENDPLAEKSQCGGQHGCESTAKDKDVKMQGAGDSMPIQNPPGPNPNMNDATQHQSYRRLVKPHSKYMIAGLQLSSAFVVILYFVLPTVIRMFPSIMGEIAFLNRVRWPPFMNLSNPAEFGLSNTRSFRLDTDDGVQVGVWHVLPSRLQTSDVSDIDYEAALSHGDPVILYFHGNAGTRGGWHRVQLYKKFAAAGFHVITLDYRGYGDSSGHPTEDGLCHDSYQLYRWLLDRVGDSPLYIWGHSMGTGVATKVTRRICDEGRRLDVLFLEAPFNNIIEAATQHPFSQPFKFLPWFTWGFVEAMKYNKIHFSSDSSIGEVTVPTLILHAEDDGIVPYRLGQKLYESALTTKQQGRVDMVTFAGRHDYGHKHIHKSPELLNIMRAFIHGDLSKTSY